MANALVLEDDIHTVVLINTLLTQLGFETFTADNGIEALSVLENSDVALIILDILLPGLSGIQVLEIVRENHPDVAVLIASAHLDTDTMALAVVAGTPRLTKPFSKSQFDAAIRSLGGLKA